MRLSEEELKALSIALEGVDGEVFLYGSRTNETKKGGDIDILIFSETDKEFELSMKIAVSFFKECEEKIDVTVINPKKITKEQQSFINSITLEKLK